MTLGADIEGIDRRIRAALEATSDYVVLLDREFRILYVSRKVAELNGVSPDHYVGLTHWEAWPSSVGTDVERSLRHAMTSGEPVRLEHNHADRGGLNLWLEIDAVPSEDGLAVLFRDVTQRRLESGLLRSVADGVPALVAYMDADLVYRFCNRAYEAFFGRPRSAIVGRSLCDVIGPEAFAAARPSLERTLAGNETAYSCWYDFAGVGRRFVRIVYRPRRDPKGMVEGIDVLLVDETERRQAEETLRRSGETFESLVRNSPLGVYAVDADFRLAIVSQGAQRVFANVRPLIGRDFAEVLRIVWPEPFASEATGRFRHTLETGEPYHAPSSVERRQDLDEVESYDWKIERLAMPDGRFGVVCHFYDLSERQRQAEEMERRVEARTEELSRANRDLNEFAASVAHDLRAPLRAIVSSSRILLEDLDEKLSEEERALLERQATNGVRLARIVDDLLGFARLANAELEKKEADLSALARAAADEVSRRGYAPCEVEIQNGMGVRGDPNLIGYALTNLIDNAFKFSPQGGKVTVGEEGGTFYVRDEGVGFDMAHADKLFAAFERLVGQEAFAGTGVGLANVKRIVERHGGRIWATSELGKGATFWFTLG